MRTEALTRQEREMVQIIRNSGDPGKAMVVAIDIMQRMIAGEDPGSIMERYGIDWEAVQNERQ